MKKKRPLKYIVIALVFFIIINLSFSYTAYLMLDKLITKKTEEILLKINKANSVKGDLEKIKLQLLKAQREKKEIDIIEFFQIFDNLKKLYEETLKSLGPDTEERFISIQQFVQINIKRIDAAEQFKDELISLDSIPESLQNFYDLNLEFLDNEIYLLRLINTYYESKNYSSYDGSLIKQSIKDRFLLKDEIDKEIQKVLEEFELEILVKPDS